MIRPSLAGGCRAFAGGRDPLSESMIRSFFDQPLPPDYPNGLAAPRPLRAAFGPAWAVPLALFVACLVPRAIMSAKIGSVCPDGTLYIRLAQAIQAGDYRAGFEEMSVNTYPVILALLNQAGLDWETAGKFWGVLLGSLTVLPLWGLVRRQFDERVALVAGLLYAFHPRLIESSPELTRDPTFWFVLTLAIWLAWRAVTEVRWLFFASAGLAFGLAFLTRFEGVFLLIPLVLWSLHRARALEQGRRRLILGSLLMLGLVPAILVVLNVVFLRDTAHWQLIRTRPLELACVWLGLLLGHQPDPATSVACGLAEVPTPIKFREALWLFVHTGEVGLTPCFALLMFGGLAAWRRVWFRSDHQPLFYVALGIAAGIWIHLWCAQSSNHRYLFAIVIMGSPFAALGLLSLGAWVARVTARENLRATTACAVFLAVSAVGIGDALCSNYGFRHAEPQLGQWIRERYGPRPVILGSSGVTPVISFYAAAEYRSFPPATPDGIILASTDIYKPDVILLLVSLHMRSLGAERYTQLIERLQGHGFEPANSATLPQGCERLLVLTRKEKGAHLVQRPTAGPPRSPPEVSVQ